MARLRYNGLSVTLGGAGLTNSATSITFSAALTHSGSTAVPTIAGSDYIPLSILDSTGKLTEIVYLTAYTMGATTGTISRGKENTTGVAHATGDGVVNGPTVADIGFSGAQLTKSTTQAIAATTEIMISFDGENFDTDAYHDNATNNTRITIPEAGFYLVGASLRIDAVAVDKRVTAFLRKNGTFYPEGGYTRMTNAVAGETVSMPLSSLVQLAAGDYLELGAYHTDTVSRNVSATSGGTTFWIRRVG